MKALFDDPSDRVLDVCGANRLKIVLLGPPGAGKGTQAVLLADYIGIDRISTGDLFREHQQNETDLGLLAGQYMTRGELVPNEVTIKMVMRWIKCLDPGDGFLLDGFPRNLEQAHVLDTALDPLGGVDKVIHIMVQEDELMRRLSGRLVCRNCQASYNVSSKLVEAGRCNKCAGELYQREDDGLASLNKRIQVYSEETEPLVQYYKNAGKLGEINGEGSVKEVSQAVLAAVG